MRTNKAKIIGGLLFLLLSIFIFHQQVEADSGEVTFVIHKRIYQDKTKMPQIQGNVYPGEDSPMLKDSKGIAGAVYCVYDVTALYWQMASEGKNNEEILSAMKVMTPEEMPSGSMLSEQTTGTDSTFGSGVAKFNLPAKVIVGSVEKDAVYLFHEESSPISDEDELSGNTVVSLPIDDMSLVGEPYIHLYPKSVIRNVVSLTKRLNEEKQDFAYGEPIEYVIETTIPTNLMYLSKYTLLDTYDSPLNYISGSIRILVDDVEQTSLFNFTASEATSRLSLEATGDLLRERGIKAGAKIKIIYQMILTETANPDIPYDNSVRLATLFEGSSLPDIDSDAIPVVTSGKRFIKTDMNDQKKGLAGASFLVKNTEGNYLIKTPDGFDWQKGTEGAYSLVSDDSGNFAVKGLGYGKYKLVETTAPSGYKLLDQEIPFTVEAGSYQVGDQLASPLVVVNAKTTTSSSTTPTSTNDSKPPTKTSGSGSSNIPKMGEVSSISAIVLGGAIIIGIGFYSSRRKIK